MSEKAASAWILWIMWALLGGICWAAIHEQIIPAVGYVLILPLAVSGVALALHTRALFKGPVE